MVSILGHADGEFANQCILDYLDLVSIIRLEVVNQRSNSTILECRTRWASAAELLSGFELSGELMTKTVARSTRLTIALLRQALTAGVAAPCLVSEDTAKTLVSALQRAETNAAAHLKQGGALARVLVANFKFPLLDPGAAEPPPAADAPDDARRAGAPIWPGLYPSEPVHFTVSTSKDGNLQTETLELRLAWLRDVILVNLQSKGPKTDADAVCGGHFDIDLRAVSQDLCLCMRGMQVDIDTGWVRGYGVCAIPRSRGATVKSLAAGVPFVIGIRDSALSESPVMNQRIAANVHALHLEVSRLHEAWQ